MREVQTICPEVFDCPNGTITVEIHESARLMRLAATTGVDPYDWFIVLEVLKRFGVDNPVIDGPYWDRDVDMWLISLDTRGVSLI